MLLKRFFGDRRAAVAPMFALAVIPIIGFTGAAIDYSRMSAARSEMQDALDATALMLSKQAPGMSASDLTQKAESYFASLYHNPDATGVKVSASYTATGGAQLTVSGSGTVPTTVTHLLNVQTMDFKSSSTVKWGSTKLRVALVLDNTGSMMQSNKLPALKTATHQLLTILQAAATNAGDVQVSLVPFSADVKVNKASFYTQPWINWADWKAANGSCSRGSGFNSQSSCTATQFCSKSWYSSKSTCQNNGGTWYGTAGTWTADAKSSWDGCFMDRGLSDTAPDTQAYDTWNTTPVVGDKSTWFVADPNSNQKCPGSTVSPLGYDWAALSTAVDDMQANGSTNQTIGLAWGWQTLSEGAPFNVPTLPPDTKPIIILLSDGLNTQDRWYGDGSSLGTSDDAKIDARMSTVCTNVKAAKITIYSVQVNTGGDPTSTVLQNCASDASMFYALTSSGQIVTTFQTIATNLAKLRISQ